MLDPNGEYANENPQDQGCLKNMRPWPPSAAQDVVTYGLVEHPYDETGRTAGSRAGREVWNQDQSSGSLAPRGTCPSTRCPAISDQPRE